MFSKTLTIIKKILVSLITSFLVLLFAYAAGSKLGGYHLFKFQLGKSPYTMHYAGIISWALPLAEFIIVALLVVKKTKIYGLYASFFLMFLFTGYIYALLHYSYYVPCSCGGILSGMDWHQHLKFNVIVTICTLTAIFLDNPTASINIIEEPNFV